MLHAGPGRRPCARSVNGDLLVAQRGAHVLDQVGQPLALQRVGVDLEQQVGAALQVEAEVQPLLGTSRQLAATRPAARSAGRTGCRSSAARTTRTTFQRERWIIGAEASRLLQDVVGGGRLAAGAHVGDHRLDHLDVDAGAISTPTSASSTLVTLPIMPEDSTTVSPRLTAADHVLVLLRPLLLRADHQEVEQHDHRDERQDLEQEAAAARRRRRRRLGQGRGGEQGVSEKGGWRSARKLCVRPCDCNAARRTTSGR